MNRNRNIARAICAIVLPVAAACALMPKGHTRPSSSGTETIRLRHMAPSQFVAALAVGTDRTLAIPMPNPAETPRFETHLNTPPLHIPAGITMISPNDRNGTLAIRGSASDIENVRSLARMLDSEPKQLHLHVDIVRAPIHSASATVDSTVVAAGDTDISNGTSLSLPLYGDSRLFVVTLTPHILGDGRVTLPATILVRHGIAGVAENDEQVRGALTLAPGKSSSPGRVILGANGEPGAEYRVEMSVE